MPKTEAPPGKRRITMPLRAGSSEQVMDANRQELWRAYRRSGKIGNTRPRDKAHAREIIEGIVWSKSREK